MPRWPRGECVPGATGRIISSVRRHLVRRGLAHAPFACMPAGHLGLDQRKRYWPGAPLTASSYAI